MSVMDTIMTATRCVSSVLVGLVVAAVAARIVAARIVVAVVAMAVVTVMARVVGSQGQVPTLAVLTTESKRLVR